ncbi:MAG: hypothetical protein A2X36_12975 [Elusimicrobia bacterium GWA2_69_24]|nr:MAG: hypothetical protein A2X36_12975 [Elusimicrobia bacterium GWA2_69_24]
MESLPLNDVRRIVLLWIGRLGDILLSTPALAAVRARFPGARITLIAGEAGGAAGPLLVGPDRILLLRRCHRPLENLRLVRELRAEEADLFIDLNTSFSRASSTLTWLARARVKLGFDKGRGTALFDRLLEAPGPEEHMLARYGRLAQALGAPFEPRLRIQIPEADLERGRALADSLLQPGGEGIVRIGIHPGNFKKFDNRWPEEGFAALARNLLTRPECRLFFFSGPGEEAPVRAIVDRLPRPVPILGPQTAATAAGVLQALDLFIGNATGTAHLAVAAGVPTFLLLGDYTRTVWTPQGFCPASLLPDWSPQDVPAGLVAEMGGVPHFCVVSDCWESCRSIPAAAAWKALESALGILGRRRLAR